MSRFFGITIAMFFDDHGFPHFHARHAEGEAKDPDRQPRGNRQQLRSPQLRFVLAWAELRREEFEENWRRARLVRLFKRSSHCNERPDPDITAVSIVDHGALELTFADGLSGEVNVLDRMRGPVFEDARTPEGFA